MGKFENLKMCEWVPEYSKRFTKLGYFICTFANLHIIKFS